MPIRSRTITALAAAALAAGALTAATATSATAAPATAQSCYGSAKSYTTDPTYDFWPQGSALATTTSNCGDINVKPNSDVKVHTCFRKSDGTDSCNADRTIKGGTWGLAATAVLDGTKFWLVFSGSSSGLVAY
ncbi:hypothetical protein AB0H86_08825 [Streptomyces sp. NPDC050997]|uniref:hypothetical protein n=1 Tax=Streptomyces sp. NPDC050997 TaxID=3155519 RepID=UPI0034436F39